MLKNKILTDIFETAILESWLIHALIISWIRSTHEFSGTFPPFFLYPTIHTEHVPYSLNAHSTH